MSAPPRGKALRQAVYGLTVERAASNIAQSGFLTLFTVAGGRILLTSLVGEVTTVIQAQADAVKVGTLTGAITTDLCATVDVNAAAVSTLFGFPSLGGTAVLGSSVSQFQPFVVQAGIIRMNAAASNTGQMKWTLNYLPLDDAATVVAS